MAAYQEYDSGSQFPNDYELLTKKLKCVEKKLDNAVDAILNGVDANKLKEKMKELEQQKYDIEEKLDSVESIPPKLTFEHFLYTMTDIVNKADENDFKKLIDTIVNRVIIKDKTAIVCINLTDSNATPTLEQILFKVSDALIFLKNFSAVGADSYFFFHF